MTPTVGRAVHYVSYGTPGDEYSPECRAATVTEFIRDTESETVGLAVLNPTGLFFRQGVYQDEEHHSPGTWHWPERVE